MKKADWRYVPMGKVCDFIGGSQPPKQEFIYEPRPGYIRLIQIQDYKSDKKKTYIPESKARRFCDEKDVMIGRYGPPIFQILRGLEGSYNVALMKASPREEVLDREYLYYFLKNPALFNYVVVNSERTAGQDGVRKELLETYTIPLPPLAEQRRIAAILDKADAIRRKRQQAIQYTEELLRAAFLDMFGDPVTNPKGWEVKPLSSLIRKDDRINYGVVQPGDHIEGGKPIVRVGDFKNGKIQKKGVKRISPDIEKQYVRSRLRGDEILIACVGSIGEIAMVDESLKGWNIVRAVARVPLKDEIHRTYVAEYLRSSFVQAYFKNETRTVSQPTLNIKQITETPVLLPPKELRDEFENLFSANQSQIKRQKDSMEESEHLFNSLLQRAFRGEL